MSLTFGQKFASFYDLFYQSKDYEKECQFIESIITPFLPSSKKDAKKSDIKFLDVACGTGGHTQILARKGYNVTGSDLSPDMITFAKAKAQKEGLQIKYVGSLPMQAISFPEKFDVLICMFAAIDYLVEKKDLHSFLHRAFEHLSPNGLLLFDFYNGIEAVRHFDPCRVKEFTQDNKKIIRISRTTQSFLKSRLDIEFESILIEGNHVIFREKETHPMRFYLPLDMRDLVEESGFDVVKFCPFMEPDKDICVSDWNLSLLARKR